MKMISWRGKRIPEEICRRPPPEEAERTATAQDKRQSRTKYY